MPWVRLIFSEAFLSISPERMSSGTKKIAFLKEPADFGHGCSVCGQDLPGIFTRFEQGICYRHRLILFHPYDRIN